MVYHPDFQNVDIPEVEYVRGGHAVIVTLSCFYFILYYIVEWFRRREGLSSRFPECRHNRGRICEVGGHAVVTTLSCFYFILYDIVEWFRRRKGISSRFPKCRHNRGRICWRWIFVEWGNTRGLLFCLRTSCTIFMPHEH